MPVLKTEEQAKAWPQKKKNRNKNKRFSSIRTMFSCWSRKKSPLGLLSLQPWSGSVFPIQGTRAVLPVLGVQVLFFWGALKEHAPEQLPLKYSCTQSQNTYFWQKISNNTENYKEKIMSNL